MVKNNFYSNRTVELFAPKVSRIKVVFQKSGAQDLARERVGTGKCDADRTFSMGRILNRTFPVDQIVKANLKIDQCSTALHPDAYLSGV